MSLLVSRSETTPRDYWQAEDAHEQTAIEWWFFQGYYRDSSGARSHFMISLFRSNLGHPWFRQWHSAGERGVENGFQLISAMLDSAGEHRFSTWVDTGVLLKAVTDLPHIDLEVQKAIAMELEPAGAWSPIHIKPPPALFCASPLAVSWESFSLQQEPGRFVLQLDDPALGRGISLEFTATAPGLDVACGCNVVPLGTGMAYRTYPWLSVNGALSSGEKVAGEAWMDHQWGDTGWFYDSDGRVLLGWDWFGFNLEDGSAWLIMVHRNAQTGLPVAMHATVSLGSGPAESTHRLTVAPLRYWESPQTQIRYPVEWRIELPDRQACFNFTPLADNQEIAAFGVNRSIWEGAGTVRGTVAGREVQGRARGEFRGYGLHF